MLAVDIEVDVAVLGWIRSLIKGRQGQLAVPLPMDCAARAADASLLFQAEELLETAVHFLLGIGSNSSAELYDKIQAVTHQQHLVMQVGWLLRKAVVAVMADRGGSDVNQPTLFAHLFACSLGNFGLLSTMANASVGLLVGTFAN